MGWLSDVRIVASCLAVYLFMIFAIRLFGKKQLAQLTVIDLVFILLISNAVQNAMVGPDTTLQGGLVAAATLFIANACFKLLLYKFPHFSKVIQGEPLLLIYRGKLNRKNMEKAMVTMEEMKEVIREHGVSEFEDVDLAVLEIDGNISVLSDDYAKQTMKKRQNDKTTKKQQNS